MPHLCKNAAATLVAALLSLAPLAAAAPPALPYRFLLVIHDQWQDPASEVIQERNEFSMLCALLRSWGLPFDIHRLDQQRFDAYLHAQVERAPAAGAPLALRLRYDEHYCGFFRTHPSTWILHLSDQTRADLGRPVPERQAISLAAGLGPHSVRP